MNMKVKSVETTQATCYTFCDYTLKNNKSCKSPRKHKTWYSRTAPKRLKTSLPITMSNINSCIPTSGFFLRHIFTILLLQLLTISNYLQMGRLSVFVDAIKIDSIEFPSHILIGNPVTMSCNYRLDREESIDSIKWYKDGKEFYRNVFTTSNDRDRVIAYPMNGTRSLDRQLSGLLKIGEHQLVLQHVTLQSSGVYSCQITLSGPPFDTVNKEKTLSVYVNPQKVPEIIGLRPEYTTEETIQITCKSERSYPAAELNFFIDNEAASEDLVERLPIIHHKDELKTQTSRIILRYPLSPSSVASSVRQFGNARNEKLYPYEKRPRNVRAILPPKEPNYLPYQSSQTETRRRHFITTYDDENRSSKLNFKCTAKIGNGYWQSVEEETVVKRQVLPLESRSSASSVQILRRYSMYQTSRVGGRKLFASWKNLLYRILSTFSSSLLCLSIIVVFFQWLMSKQLRSEVFHPIGTH